MLKITIPPREIYDDESGEFYYVDRHELQLEHSLISVSKWEAKWHKAFLDEPNKTVDETIDYIRCMCMNRDVDPEIFKHISREDVLRVQDYITDPMTATHFLDDSYPDKPQNLQQKDKITSELIYYWMVSLGIPFECEKWHLNRLLTLIKVCGKKNEAAMNSSKARGKHRKSASRPSVNTAAINAQRRAAMNSRG